MPAEIEVAGRRVLVVGGSGVLGGAIAEELRNRRATVMLAGRNAASLHETATRLGPDVHSVVCDLTVANHITHMIDTAVATMGGLEGLVNAAGAVAFGPLADADPDVLDRMVAVNLVGPLKTIQAALPHLDGGFILNITGVVAETPMASMVPYSAVKAGLSGGARRLLSAESCVAGAFTCLMQGRRTPRRAYPAVPSMATHRRCRRVWIRNTSPESWCLDWSPVNESCLLRRSEGTTKPV